MLSDDWKSCFFQGQHVDMSMVFNRRSFQGSACPGCKTVQLGSENEDIECSVCGINFQRVVKPFFRNRKGGLFNTIIEEHLWVLPQSSEVQWEYRGPKTPPHNCAKAVDDPQLFRRVRVTAVDFGIQAVLSTIENARDIAEAFGDFANELPGAYEEITNSVLLLRKLAKRLTKMPFIKYQEYVDQQGLAGLLHESEMALLISLDFTFKDINRLFGFLAGNNYSDGANPYERVWEKMNRHLTDESGESIGVRHERYCKILSLLKATIR